MSITPALELDVLVPERQAIKIRSTLHPESRLYELRAQSELSLEQIANLGSLAEKVEPMMSHDGLSPAEGRILDDWLAEIMGLVFHTPLEPEVLAEMGYERRWAVFMHFSEVCLEEPATEQTTTPAPKRRKTSTGAQ